MGRPHKTSIEAIHAKLEGIRQKRHHGRKSRNGKILRCRDLHLRHGYVIFGQRSRRTPKNDEHSQQESPRHTGLGGQMNQRYEQIKRTVSKEDAITEFVKYLQKNDEEGTEIVMERRSGGYVGNVLEFKFGWKEGTRI